VSYKANRNLLLVMCSFLLEITTGKQRWSFEKMCVKFSEIWALWK